jgi:capsular polysaccharide biosynthesis protein
MSNLFFAYLLGLTLGIAIVGWREHLEEMIFEVKEEN